MPVNDRNLRLKIDIDSNTAGAAKAAAALEAVDDAAKHLTPNARKAGDALGNVGDEAKDSAAGVDHLDRRITKLTARIKMLGEEFRHTGNESILKDISRDRGELAKLTRIRKALQEIVPVAAVAGREAGHAVTSGIGDALAVVPPEVKIAAITFGGAVAAAMLPALGAGIAGAVAGVVGLGGIAGGIALAAKDSRVKASAKDLGQTVMAGLTGAGEQFVEPTLQALGIFKNEWRKTIIPELRDGLGELTDDVDDLAMGAAGFARNFLPGLERAFGTDAVKIFAAELPRLGDALGDLIGDVSESKGAMEGLRATLSLITATVDITNRSVSALSYLFHYHLAATAKLSGGMEDLAYWVSWFTHEIPGLSQAWKLAGDYMARINDIAETWQGNNVMLARSNSDTATSLEDIADAAKKADEKVDRLKDTFDDLFDIQMDGRDAARSFEQALDDMADSVKENGKNLDITTEAGRQNQAVIDELIRSAKKIYDAEIQAGDGSEQATLKAQKNYEGRINSVRQYLLSLGLEKTAIEEIIRMLGAIPAITKSTVEIGVKYSVSGQVPGEHSGYRIDELTSTVTASTKKKANTSSHLTTSGVTGLASGGYAPMNDVFTVGEQGIELMGTRNGRPYVMSGPQTRRFMGSTGGAGRSVQHTINIQLNGRMLRQLAIDDALGRGVEESVIAGAYP